MIVVVFLWLLTYVLLSLRKRACNSGPSGWPAIGHLPYLLQKDFHKVLQSWSTRFGGAYRVSILGMPGYIISDPVAITSVLCRAKERHEVPKHLASYKELNVLWGGYPSIFTSASDDNWRLVRKTVAPAFSTANLRYAPPGLPAVCVKEGPGQPDCLLHFCLNFAEDILTSWSVNVIY